MLVNAAQFPGPAIWQVLMLMALPFFVWGIGYRSGRYAGAAVAAYAALGVILLVVIAAKG